MERCHPLGFTFGISMITGPFRLKLGSGNAFKAGLVVFKDTLNTGLKNSILQPKKATR
jgi:hypothetical protein